MQLLRWIPTFVLSHLALALPADGVDAADTAAPAPQPPSCDALSKTRLSLVLSNVNYGSFWIYSTPAHLAVAQGKVGFTVLNNLVGAPITCTATSMQEFSFFVGTQAYNCDVSKMPANMEAKLSFTFDTANGGTVGVAASWNCVDSRTLKTFRYQATGSAKTGLECSTSVNQTKNWQIGEIFSTTTETCPAVNVVLNPTVSVVG